MFEKLLVKFLWKWKKRFTYFGHISIMSKWETVTPENWKQYKCDHEISYSDALKHNVKTKSTITGATVSWGGTVVPTFFWEKTCPYCGISMSSSGYYANKEVNRRYKPEGDDQWPIYPETGERIPKKVEGF